MRTIHIAFLFALVSLILASCSAVTSPGRFTFDDGPPPMVDCPAVEAADLGIELRNMVEFDEDQIEFQVLEVGTDAHILRGRIDELHPDGVSDDGTDNSTLLCLSFPELVESFDGPLVVRTYVDLNGDHVFQPVDEPGWQDDVADGIAVIDGEEAPTGIDPVAAVPGSFRLELLGLAFHAAPTPQHLALMIIDNENGIPVGFYRLAEIDEEPYILFLGDVLEPDKVYDVELYADFERNGFYDGQPIDHSWFETYTADVDGDVDATFMHDTDFDDLSFF